MADAHSFRDYAAAYTYMHTMREIAGIFLTSLFSSSASSGATTQANEDILKPQSLLDWSVWKNTAKLESTDRRN